MKLNISKIGKMLITTTLSAALLFSSSAVVFPQKTEAAYSSSKANAVITTGKRFMGVPYKFGASTSTTKYFDCSSFTKYVYKKQGIYLPRTSKDQAKVGTYVKRANLKKGDLVFFDTSSRNGKGVDHVAIYAGNNTLLHTYRVGVGVTTSKLSNTYWGKKYVTARRVIR